MWFHIGANMDQRMEVYIGTMTAVALGVRELGDETIISLASPAEANRAIGTIDEALKKINKQRADLGGYQNRLEHAVKGIDIAAEAGTEVCAAADGTVYTVYEDDQMGMTVVIRHENGYTTRYSSLDAGVAVSAGQNVTMGQTIGAVGTSALMENALGHHVHFAVSRNDESVDPMDFLG